MEANVQYTVCEPKHFRINANKSLNSKNCVSVTDGKGVQVT